MKSRMKSSFCARRFIMSNWRRRFFKIVANAVLLMFACPLSGCGQNIQKPHVSNAELERNIRLWQKSGITNYDFVVYKIMGSANWAPLAIQVRKGRVTSKKLATEADFVNIPQTDEGFETIENAFATIQAAYDKNLPVQITYDQDYGFPARTVINTEPTKTDHNMIVDLTKFKVVKND